MPPPKDLVRYKEVRVADRRNDQKTAAQILNADAASVTQEQLQEFILSQIKRIIHGNNAGLWKDDFVAQGILSLQDLSLGALTLVADCLATDVPGAAVRITAPAISGIFQVTTCDITTTGGYPAVGLLLSKLSPTRCLVQTSGTFSIGPLVPGTTYFVGYNGQPVAGPLGPSISGRAAIQSLGVALDTSILRLTVSPVLVLRSN